MTKLYEIYTETKPNLATLTSDFFDGATLLKGTGLYKGQLESCTIIRIITNSKDKIKRLARTIQLVNKQSQVLVSKSRIDLTVVESRGSL